MQLLIATLKRIQFFPPNQRIFYVGYVEVALKEVIGLLIDKILYRLVAFKTVLADAAIIFVVAQNFRLYILVFVLLFE